MACLVIASAVNVLLLGALALLGGGLVSLPWLDDHLVPALMAVPLLRWCWPAPAALAMA